MRISIAFAAAGLIWAAATMAAPHSQRPVTAPGEPGLGSLDLADTDLEAGGRVFAARCASCHGADGTAGSGGEAAIDTRPSPLDLTRADIRRRTDAQLYSAIGDGLPGRAM